MLIHDHELGNGPRQHLARIRRQAGIGDQHVGLVEARDRADPDHAPLRVVGDDDEPAAGIDEGAVRLGLEQVGRR